MRWLLKRQDDRGNRAVVDIFLTRELADAALHKYEARGHKQLYWVEARARRGTRSGD